MRIWRQRGEHQQAIGRSRGGRTTKIHALTDAECRPVAFLLTGGQIADCTAGAVLLEEMPRSAILHGDKGYDSDAIRRQVEGKGAMPNIPPKANRRWKNCFSPVLYRSRNAIERVFCRLKDFPHRHQIRSSRNQFPRSRLHRCGCQLLVMSLDPNSMVVLSKARPMPSQLSL